MISRHEARESESPAEKKGFARSDAEKVIAIFAQIINIQKYVTTDFGSIGRGLNWFKPRANKCINWKCKASVGQKKFDRDQNKRREQRRTSF